MPTSRRTARIRLGSSVSSTPSTMTLPRCQSSSRLMQRSSVDLPPPEGPQMTIRSPRATFRLISRSTWKSPYHLCRPMTSTATSAKRLTVLDWSPLCCMQFLLRPPGAGQSFFHASRIARHAIAADKVEECGQGIPGYGNIWRRPFWVGARGLDCAEKIKNADDKNQCRVLEQPDEGIDDVWQRNAQRLRQNDQTHHPPVGEAKYPRRLVLPAGNGNEA